MWLEWLTALPAPVPGGIPVLIFIRTRTCGVLVGLSSGCRNTNRKDSTGSSWCRSSPAAGTLKTGRRHLPTVRPPSGMQHIVRIFTRGQLLSGDAARGLNNTRTGGTRGADVASEPDEVANRSGHNLAD